MLLRSMLKAKIHRATVTEADVNYVGSITIDSALLERIDLWPGELVHVWNATNGVRLETYVIAGDPGSGTICMNGPAAHRIHVGDIVIIAAFALTDVPIQSQAIMVDADNHYLRDL